MTDLQFPKAAPNTADMLNRVKYDVSREINCHLICKIESIDAAKNTITCSSAFKRRMSDERELDYPLFVDVPLFVLSGGGAHLFIPPKVGDWCILMFNDRDIDDWWYSGELRAPASPRAHSLSDGMAIVGIRPQSNPLELALDAVMLNALELPITIKNQDCEIAINAGITLDGKAKPFTAKTDEGNITIDGKIEVNALSNKVAVKNSASNLKAILEAMLDQLQSGISGGLTPGTTGSPAPGGAPLVFPTLAVAIAAAKTEIANLLE